MKVKTSALTGAALDYAVAKCELMAGQNYTLSIDDDGILKRVNYGGMYPEWSCEWEEAGPIIERERVSLYQWLSHVFHNPTTQTTESHWDADMTTPEGKFIQAEGPTPLIAAMRCYVASKLGDEVEIPEELNQ